MNFKNFIYILLLTLLPNIISSQTKEKNDFNQNLDISFPEISISILNVKYDEYSETTITYKSKEMVVVSLGLGDEIWDKTIKVLSNDLSNVKIYQRYVTSVTISDEGPHLDLTDWKHYLSDWMIIPQNENGDYELLSSDSMDSQKFIEIDIEELKEEVRKIGGEYWYSLVKHIKSPTQYPSSIGINKVELLLTGYINNKKIEMTIVFNLPLGC